MSVFRPFDRGDILFTAVDAKPRVSLAYGRVSGSTNGWRGSTGVSGTVSLYGGVRGRRDVRADDYQSSGLSVYPVRADPLSGDRVSFVSGSYPATGSARFVRCTNVSSPSLGSITDTRWYNEHFRPIELLYDWYSQRDECYFTGSYDMYCLFMPANRTGSNHTGPLVRYANDGGQYSGLAAAGHSWAAEVWYKSTSGSFDRTLFGQQGSWRLIVGSDNTLYLNNRASGTFISGSANGAITNGVWHHCAVSVRSGTSAVFYLDGVQSKQAFLTGAFLSGTTEIFVGGYKPGSEDLSTSGSMDGCDGFIFEAKVWNRARTAAEVAHEMSGTVRSSGSDSRLLLYGRMNEGPLGFISALGLGALGSGTQNYSPLGRANESLNYGLLDHDGLVFQPAWQPNDHPTFRFLRKIASPSVELGDFRVFHLPSMYYGREIDPGSVVLSDGQYNKRGVVRVLNDDGRGCLYVSGSMTEAISGEQYQGNQRHKVGNVFYSEGLVVVTDPALWDMFDPAGPFWDPSGSLASGTFPDLLGLDYRGHTRFYTKTFNCRLPSAQGNASANPTFSRQRIEGSETDGGTRANVVALADGVWITAVGLFNEERKLVAVAKFAQPIRKREKDKTDLRLRMDF